jgi:putative ABC transport system substrate-binding protein
VRRRQFITLLGGMATAWPLALRAQSSPEHPLVGVLSPQSAAGSARNVAALRSGLRELGRVEGRDVWFEFRYADGVSARLPALASEIVALKPDVIVVGSPAGILAVHGATQTIPVVFFSPLDPVSLGVAKSIARPGGNFTGTWTMGGNDSLVGKRVELLKEVVPALLRMGVMIEGVPPDEILLRHLAAATQSLGLTYQVFKVRTPAEFSAALEQAVRDGVQGLFVNQSSFFFADRGEVAAAVARAQLPAIYGFRENAEAGGLISYGSNLAAAYRQSARLVDKILKGAKAAEVPIEQADTYELVVNNKAAKALGLKIPESFLLRADEVIE